MTHLALDERREHVQKQLYDRYDRLNALWQQAEERIRKFHIPRPVCHECIDVTKYEPGYGEVPDFSHCLFVDKIKGKWRICYGLRYFNSDPDDVALTPITECSGQIRTNMVTYLPGLEEGVVKSTEKFVTTVDEAIDKLSAMVDVEPKVRVPQILAERAKPNGKL